MSDERANDLQLGIEFLSDSVVVTVSGDVDILTAGVFAGVLNATVDAGHRDLAVDMGGVSFFGAAGLGVFASVLLRLDPLGGTITLRSASELVRRVFAITGMSDLVVFVEPELSTPHGRDVPDDAPQVAGNGGEGDLAASGSSAPMRSSTGVVDAALGLVTTLAASTVENADGVSVTLERHGRLMTVAASDDAVKVMDGHQYDTGEGPCLSAKAEGRWFYIESLAEENRWPTFVPLALGQGIHSILSSPLMTKDRPQGALNIYSSKEHAFSTRDQELAALFSAQASEILTTAGPDETDEQARQRFTTALAARQVIHQAQGMIMERNGLTTEVVAGALRRAARAAGVTVLAYAAEVVASVGTDRGAKEHGDGRGTGPTREGATGPRDVGDGLVVALLRRRRHGQRTRDRGDPVRRARAERSRARPPGSSAQRTVQRAWRRPSHPVLRRSAGPVKQPSIPATNTFATIA